MDSEDISKNKNVCLKRVECYICGKNCPITSIKAHLRSHTHVSVYDCEECGDRFASKRTLDQHRITHKSHFVCVTCNKKFEDADHLKPHICFEKLKERKYICEICNKGFYTKYDLRRHIRSHTNEKPYVCDICNKGFTQRSNRDLHYRTHKKEIERNNADVSGKNPKVEAEKPWICAICFQSFGYRQHLNRHLRVHTKEKPYVCNICNKGFSQNTYLKVHILLHSNQRPFKCEKCDKSFPCKWKMTAHMKRHKGPHVFCSVCNKGFFSASDCDKHYVVHSGKKYICDICHKSFSQLTYLETHYLKHANQIKNKSVQRACKNNIPLENDLSIVNVDSKECVILKADKIPDINNIDNEKLNELTDTRKLLENDHMEKKKLVPVETANVILNYTETVTMVEKDSTPIKNKVSKEKAFIAKESQDINKNIGHANQTLIRVTKNRIFSEKSIESNNRGTALNVELSAFKEKDINYSNYTLQNLYMCKVCKIMFYNEEDLNLHSNDFMKKNNYKCCMCQQVYLSKKNLLDHHKIHDISENKKPYVTFLSVEK